MESLRVSSERFSLRIAFSPAGARLPHDVERLFKLLLDTHLEGEVTSAPPAAAFKLTEAGRALTVRVVRGETYLYEPSLAALDGARPWIRLGAGGSGALLGGALPPLGAQLRAFSTVAAGLRAALAVRELGVALVDGQAAAGYRTVVPLDALMTGAAPVSPRPSGILGGVFGSRSSPPAGEPPSGNALLEAFIAPNGVPVRARLSITAEGIALSELADVFAINFPLSLRPPPHRLTIDLRALRRIERQRAGRRTRHPQVQGDADRP